MPCSTANTLAWNHIVVNAGSADKRASRLQQDEKCDVLCNASTTVLLPEESNGLHDQDPQLEGHILVVDEGYERPQLQHNISVYMEKVDLS